MKPNLHPMYRKIEVVCACGNRFETRSTSASIHVEVCSNCHPFYTGKQNLIDTAGRVDRFEARRKRAAELQEATAAKPKKAKQDDEQPASSTDTLKKLKKTVTE